MHVVLDGKSLMKVLQSPKRVTEENPQKSINKFEPIPIVSSSAPVLDLRVIMQRKCNKAMRVGLE